MMFVECLSGWTKTYHCNNWHCCVINISVYFLLWVGFSILRVKLHAWLFEYHWNSHNQSFFLNAFILLWAHNWFCVPFVLSHALHPPQLSNCVMGWLEIQVWGLPRPKRNPTLSPSCCTAPWLYKVHHYLVLTGPSR